MLCHLITQEPLVCLPSNFIFEVLARLPYPFYAIYKRASNITIHELKPRGSKRADASVVAQCVHFLTCLPLVHISQCRAFSVVVSLLMTTLLSVLVLHILLILFPELATL
jgi:hypothetical protein